MTLRLRLTLGYSMVLGAVLLLFGAAVYILLSNSLTAEIEHTLITTADEIVFSSRRDVRGILLPPLNLVGNVGVQVWGRSSQDSLVLFDTNMTPPMEGAFDADTLGSPVRVFSDVASESGRLRVLTVPLIVAPDDSIVGYLQLASSMETVDQARRMLLIVLAGGGGMAVALAALIGWWTGGAALRPLDQMTETAVSITRADDLSRRIMYKGPPKGEVGRLVVAFNQTMERLENLFEAQRRFLADISHELRTPLTAIRGNVDLIRRMGKVDEESLQAITSEGERMTRMVKDLLLLARAETGNLPLAQEVVELDTLLLEVFQQAKMMAGDRLEVRLGKEDQVRVLGDRDRLKQVVLNLVANAVEHTPTDGTVTLGVSADANWARLSVSDTGPGIPKEEQGRIFDRFYRGDPSRKRSSQGGAGLGLSIADWITRRHNGRIELSSEVGQGTTFYVYLPRLKEEGQKTGNGA